MVVPVRLPNSHRLPFLEHRCSTPLLERLTTLGTPSLWTTDYVQSPEATRFQRGGLSGVFGKVRVPSDGDLELILRLPNGTPTAIANFNELAPDEEVTIEVPKGEVVKE